MEPTLSKLEDLQNNLLKNKYNIINKKAVHLDSFFLLENEKCKQKKGLNKYK